MPRTFTATSKAAETPDNLGDLPGMFDLRFDGTEEKVVKGGQYQKDPDGDLKLQWNFTVLDDEGEPWYFNGDPIEVNKLTGIGFNVASKTVPAEVKVLKALHTPAEHAKFEAGEGTEESKLIGRVVQGELFINKNGFLGVGDIIAARKKRSGTKTVDED